jgi:hypothetical protein
MHQVTARNPRTREERIFLLQAKTTEEARATVARNIRGLDQDGDWAITAEGPFQSVTIRGCRRSHSEPEAVIVSDALYLEEIGATRKRARLSTVPS